LATETGAPFAFICPACQIPLETVSAVKLRCPVDGNEYGCPQGVWHFLPPERMAYYQQFMHEYEAVRKAEGRGSTDPAYYRSLPFEDRSGLMRADWKIRARSYTAFLHNVIQPLEKSRSTPLKILDLGAGNGWLSNRLAQRGHLLAAVDLQTNAFDGLGAHIYYETSFTPVQAEFEHLPFASREADILVFNASFHYAVDYTTTLKEAIRILKPQGQLVILDSPVYRQSRSGEQMVHEREFGFVQKYGFASNAIPSRNYLTDKGIGDLSEQAGLTWSTLTPSYGVRWSIRPWIARLRGNREPARFLILVGKLKANS